MLDAATIKRFDSALPLGFSALKELATNMRSEGLSQAAIYHIFDSFGHHLSEAGRDPFEQAMIWTSIEGIVGWHSRQYWWFDHFLTKEEIDEYRKMMGYPLCPLCFVNESSKFLLRNDALDNLILTNQKLEALQWLRQQRGFSIGEAIAALCLRYDELRAASPARFTCGDEEYWKGLYS